MLLKRAGAVMSALVERLREKGLKVTPQRMAIYSMLMATTTHPTAEAVWEHVKNEYPAVSFNTVYTTLNTLEQSGLVQRLHIGGVAHFDAKVQPHAHLYCNHCGYVDDHHGTLGVDYAEIARQVAAQTGFAVGHLELNFYGLCTKCLDS